MTRNVNYSRIPIAGVRLEKPSENSCNGYLLGGLQIGDQKLHVEAVRLTEEGGKQIAWHVSELGLEETDDVACSCDQRVEDLHQVSGYGDFTSQRLSGHEGEWTVFATPYLQ